MNENLDSATEKKAKYAKYHDEILAAVCYHTGIDLEKENVNEEKINSILNGRKTLIYGRDTLNNTVYFEVKASITKKDGIPVPYIEKENVRKFYSISDPQKYVHARNCPPGYFEINLSNGTGLSKIDDLLFNKIVENVFKKNIVFDHTYTGLDENDLYESKTTLFYSNREGNQLNSTSIKNTKRILKNLMTYSFVSDIDGSNKIVFDKKPGVYTKDTGEKVPTTLYRLVYFPPRSDDKNETPKRVNLWFSEQNLGSLARGKFVKPDEIENDAIDIGEVRLNFKTEYLEPAYYYNLTKKLNDDLVDDYRKCINTYGLKGAYDMISNMQSSFPSLGILKAKDEGEKETQAAEKTESVEKKEKPSVKKSPAAKKPAEKAEKVVSGPRIK